MAEINANNAGEVAKTVKSGIYRDGAVVGPSTVRYSPSLKDLVASLLKARAKIKNPPKDSINPHFKSRYADLATVLDTVTGPLLENNLLLVQLPCEMDDAPALTTRLLHVSGEWIETTIKLRPAKADPQGVGSATTYARRYAVLAVLGITADDDDDGNAASRPTQQSQQAKPQGTPYPQKPSDDGVDAKTVSRFVGLFAKCETRQDYQDVCEQITAGVQSGAINAATREALRKPAQDTHARVNGQPAKA